MVVVLGLLGNDGSSVFGYCSGSVVGCACVVGCRLICGAGLVVRAVGCRLICGFDGWLCRELRPKEDEREKAR